jgi:hypothetical protein
VNANVKKVLETILESAEAVKVLLDEFEKSQPSEGRADQGGSPGGETAVSGPTPAPEGQEEAGAQEGQEFVHCTMKFFKGRLLLEAARTAIDINPMNAPMLQGPMAALGGGGISTPEHIALLTSKYWQPQARQLTVSFMETTAADLRARILLHMNAWSARCGISFAWTQGAGDVRISRGQGGYWSYLGTDILHIPRNRQTMNLQSFTMQTPESEYKRVVRHEVGHSLGYPHEHMRKDLVARIDPQKAIRWFAQTQGWDQQTVQQQVLTPLDESSLMATPADEDSIMCYQLPASITNDGKPIKGGADINESDYAFAAKIYPKPGGQGGDDLDWLV